MYLVIYVLTMIICGVLYVVSPKKLFARFENTLKNNSILLKKKHLISVENDRDIYNWWEDKVIRIISLSLLFVMAISLVGIADILVNGKRDGGEIAINRPSEDEDDIDVSLSALYQDETTENINVTISKREYTSKELDDFFEDGFDAGFKEALGSNEDYDRIDSSLNLIKHLPDNPLNVEWQIEPDDVFDQSGELVKEIDKEIVGEVTLKLKYGDDIRIRTKKMIVYPKVLNKSEIRSKNLKDAIGKINEDNPSENVVKIPRIIDGTLLNDVEDKDTSYVFIFLIVLVPVLLYMKEKQELSKLVKERESKLLEEYAEFISKLVLYLKAGGTIKGSFARMVDNTHDEDDPLYIEINAMVNEINSGVSENVSYERLSKRLNLPCYVRLMNLLIQNHSKGSRRLLDMLKAERATALKEQRDYAKKKGEEASTKLLFPMIILLVVSMVIIMVPAILSFGI